MSGNLSFDEVTSSLLELLSQLKRPQSGERERERVYLSDIMYKNSLLTWLNIITGGLFVLGSAQHQLRIQL